MRKPCIPAKAAGFWPTFALSAGFALIAAGNAPALAQQTAKDSACTALEICYCVTATNRAAIDANVIKLRARIAEEKAKGKAIGYLSLPLSTAGGGYFRINKDIGALIKTRIEARFGTSSVWVLDPGADEANLPSGASGADYMLMWTQILEGAKGTGEDFDFVHFAGPSDFAAYFGLNGQADMDKIDARFEEELQKDAGLKRALEQNRLTKQSFRNYYALRASVTFSAGAHDEWNIVRLLNERRRTASATGVTMQLPMMFDGRAIPPNGYEATVAAGYTGKCSN
jgi:hypothetical protein